MLADGHQHLAGHVTALLCAGGLVLDVDASGALLNEQLRQLHHRRQAAMARVRVRDDGAEVVDVCHVGALLFGSRQALLSLLSVVEELCHEQMRNLVRNGGLINAGKHGVATAGPLGVSMKVRDSRRGNQPDQGQARPRQTLLKMTAIQRHRRCRGIWPSG